MLNTGKELKLFDERSAQKMPQNQEITRLVLLASIDYCPLEVVIALLEAKRVITRILKKGERPCSEKENFFRLQPWLTVSTLPTKYSRSLDKERKYNSLPLKYQAITFLPGMTLIRHQLTYYCIFLTCSE